MNRPPVFVADIDDASDLVLTLQEVLDESMAVAGFDLGIARLLVADGSALEALASRGLRDPNSLSDDQRVAVTRATFAATLYVPELSGVEGFLAFKREGARAALVIPMLARGELIGAIELASRRPRKVPPAKVRLLEAIGGRAGVAAQKARLHDHTVRAYAEVQKSQEALLAREAETRMLAMVAARTDNAAIITDARRRIEWVNAGYTQLTGYTLDEVRGKSPGAILQGRDTDPAVVAHMREQLNKGEGFKVELANYDKAGRKYWLAVEVQPIHDANGTLTNFMALESDISERKRAEEALRQREELYRRAISAADAVPYYLDYVNNRYRFMGEGIEAVTGYTAAEMTPELIASLIETVEMRGVAASLPHDEAIRQTREGKLPDWKEDLRIRTRSGDTRWLTDTSIQALGADGTPSGAIGILQDITERKQAELRLQLSSQILQSIGNLVLVGNSKGEIVYVSPSAKTVLGYEPDELLGEGWWQVDRGHGDAAEIARERDYIMRAASGAHPVDGHPYEHRIRRKDGEWRWLMLADAKGPGDLVIGVGTDITARKQIESDLHASNALNTAMVASSLDAIIIVDSQGKVIEFNQVAEEIFGYRREAVLGTLMSETIVPPHYRASHEAGMRHYNATGEGPVLGKRIEITGLRANGEEFPIELAISPARLGDREVFTAYVRDITEQKRAARELQAERDFALQVMNSMGQGLTITDAQGRFEFVNRAYADMLGYKPEDLIGRVPSEFTVTDDLALLEEARLARRSGQSSRYETRLRRADGRTADALIVGVPRYRAGAVAGSIAVITDLSERKEIEQALASARDQAVESSRLKSEFLAMMSHEIRTPMNGVIVMSDLLQQSRLDEEQREYAEIVSQEARALLRIINDILDFSKIEAGRLILEPTDFDLRAALEGAVDAHAAQARQKGLSISAFVSPGLPARARGDEGRIRQVLGNLVNNAVKFTAAGSVEARVTAGDGMSVLFEVRDTGIGITPEAQMRLFQPFAQADGSITRKYGGTGLGLVICRRLVELMGGEIGVRSELGKGATFWFSLPLERVDGRPAGARPLSDALARLKVLALSEDASQQELIGIYLSAWNVRADRAATGAEALAKLREAALQNDPYQLSLVDADMLSLNPLALIRAVQADPALAATQFILLSPLKAAEQIREAMAAGYSAALIKPILQSMLHDALAAHLLREAPTPGVSPTEKAAMPSAPAAGSILVVEDNPANQRVALHALRSLGHVADVVATGVEAVARLAAMRHPYRLALMDVHMPDLDGLAATRQIREWERANGGHTRIVALTANAMKGDRERCLAAGMDDYLSKPIDLGELERVVGEAGR